MHFELECVDFVHLRGDYYDHSSTADNDDFDHDDHGRAANDYGRSDNYNRRPHYVDYEHNHHGYSGTDHSGADDDSRANDNDHDRDSG